MVSIVPPWRPRALFLQSLTLSSALEHARLYSSLVRVVSWNLIISDEYGWTTPTNEWALRHKFATKFYNCMLVQLIKKKKQNILFDEFVYHERKKIRKYGTVETIPFTQKKYSKTIKGRNIFCKISAQPHSSLCIQLFDKGNNGENNRLSLGQEFVLEMCGLLLASGRGRCAVAQILTWSKFLGRKIYGKVSVHVVIFEKIQP